MNSIYCQQCAMLFEATKHEEYMFDSALCIPLPILCPECREYEKAENNQLIYT
jgi:hypothetical protein